MLRVESFPQFARLTVLINAFCFHCSTVVKSPRLFQNGKKCETNKIEMLQSTETRH